MNLCVFAGSSLGTRSSYHHAAESLGKELAGPPVAFERVSVYLLLFLASIAMYLNFRTPEPGSFMSDRFCQHHGVRVPNLVAQFGPIRGRREYFQHFCFGAHGKLIGTFSDELRSYYQAFSFPTAG